MHSTENWGFRCFGFLGREKEKAEVSKGRKMQVAVSRAVYKALGRPFIYYSIQTIPSSSPSPKCPDDERSNLCRSFCTFVSRNNTQDINCRYLAGRRMQRLYLSTEAEILKEGPIKEEPTEAVQELYLKIIDSVKAGAMPPKTWRDSLLKNCKNKEDLELAFEVLEKLRKFKTSKLWQSSNWSQQITLAVVSACIRANSPHLGLRTLQRHNVYGLTPCLGAAHSLLLYTKEQKNVSFVKEVLETMEKNFIKPEPTTADIIVSICNDTEHWSLMSNISKKFIKNGVKLHPRAYDIWISSEAKLGNTLKVWKIQELRLLFGLPHTIPSAFSCAKAYLLKCQPQEAAELILELNQEDLSDSKKKWVYEELQYLVDEWPAEVISRRDKSRRKALATELKDCISMMFNYLLTKGINLSLDVEERYCSKSTRSMDEIILG